MGFMPKFSVLLIDEGSAALASRVAHGVSVSTFSEMNLNTRKNGCFVIYMTAHDWEMAASIRQHCKEVWKPLPGDLVTVEHPGATGRLHPATDPDNFTVAWDVWSDHPYQKGDLIEGKQEEDGFGPPDATMYDEGDAVRNAYLLNDTFELAKVGLATTADRDVTKGALERFLELQSKAHLGVDLEEATTMAMAPRDNKIGRVYEYFIDQMDGGGQEVLQGQRRRQVHAGGRRRGRQAHPARVPGRAGPQQGIPGRGNLRPHSQDGSGRRGIEPWDWERSASSLTPTPIRASCWPDSAWTTGFRSRSWTNRRPGCLSLSSGATSAKRTAP